ncbi:MAG: phytase [Bacteroidales bacterium]
MHIKKTILSTVVLLSALCSCNEKRVSEGSKKAGLHINNIVTASVETTPTPRTKMDDSADDPALWYDAEDSTRSFVIGTDKKGGLATYNLQGKQLNYYPDGEMNNCDLRYGFALGKDTVDILASSNRTTHSISLYKIGARGVLEQIHVREIRTAMKGEVYGLCLYKSKISDKFYVFINSKAGEIEQWELFENSGKVDALMVRAFNVGTQTEGMVADDETAIVYLGKEKAGIYKFAAEPDASTDGTIIANSSEENTNLNYDIEGIAIYDTGCGNGYLLASSQGNYSFAVFERQKDNKYLGSFRIEDGSIDGVEETDGIDICSLPLGAAFPKGILLVQDGFNYDKKKLTSQNFKYISWEEVEKAIARME